MTVTELLDAMATLWANAFTPEVVKATKGAYYGRLRKHEGEALQKAFDEVVAHFRATKANPFPIVADFETHLLAGSSLKSTSVGPKLDFEAHGKRKAELLQQWEETQGRMVKDGCGSIVYGACWLEAKARAHALAWKPDAPDVFVDLSEADVTMIEARVVSQARLSANGAYALRRDDGGHEFWNQTQAVRTLIRAGSTPPPMETTNRLQPKIVKPKRPKQPKTDPENPYAGLD